MNRLLPLDFDQSTLQHHPHQKSWVRWRSLSPKLIAGSLMLKLALYSGIGISLSIGYTPAAYAYATQEEITVYPETGEDYNALTRRAETAARSLAQRRFDTDILQTRVIVTILTENNGQIAPILTLDVNRNDWRRRPDPQVWATYYHSTRSLLEMGGSGTPRSTQPVSPPIVPPTTPPEVAPTNPTSPTSPQ